MSVERLKRGAEDMLDTVVKAIVEGTGRRQKEPQQTNLIESLEPRTNGRQRYEP